VVILYRAGRTRAGASASASHTASIAGDMVVTAGLAAQAGIVMASTLEEFDDLVRTFTQLSGRTAHGRRLGALSNAGFECVTIGDNLGALELAAFDPATTRRLGEILVDAGIGDVVDVHDPLDLTPMADDAHFVAAAEEILRSAGVDVGLIGNVPFTPALRTVAVPGEEALDAPGGVAGRLLDLWRRTDKAWVTVVDAGPLYDPLARILEAGGIPTFRTADAALRALEAFVLSRGS
jgi:acyl-CoA synthetase (NDP forming)